MENISKGIEHRKHAELMVAICYTQHDAQAYWCYDNSPTNCPSMYTHKLHLNLYFYRMQILETT